MDQRRTGISEDLSRLRESASRNIAVQELERRRLARELHDETGQALASILLGLKAIENSRHADELSRAVESVRKIALTTLQDVRRLAVELWPQSLDDFGLVPALERLVDGHREVTGIAIHLETQLCSNRLPAEVETTLYRVIQEGLANAVKHAGARCVSIVLARREESVTALIEDDGQGFPKGSREGSGVQGMRERLELLNGSLSVESSAKNGTTLVAELPL
jgi:two-component system sensor histidine kinase UhpB